MDTLAPPAHGYRTDAPVGRTGERELENVRVLVVGWDETLLRRICWILSEDGFDPAGYHTTAEALAAANSDVGQPEIIVINTDLPEPDKEARIDALRERFGDIPVLDVTRRATNPRYDTDADDYLSKPFHADSLLEKIDHLVNEHRHDANAAS